MEQGFPVGARLRLTRACPDELQGTMATVVPDTDIEISWPSSSYGGEPIAIRLDAKYNSHLYWTCTSREVEVIEGPERSVRCLVKKRELEAHIDAIKRLIRRTKDDYKSDDMMRDLPIGTRIRYGDGVWDGLKGKAGTIVPSDDIRISHPDSRRDRLNVCRVDEIGHGHLYWAAPTDILKVIGGPERSVRCVVRGKELIAHTEIIKQFIVAIKRDRVEDELTRCADAAIDKIAEMTKAPRGVELER